MTKKRILQRIIGKHPKKFVPDLPEDPLEGSRRDACQPTWTRIFVVWMPFSPKRDELAGVLSPVAEQGGSCRRTGSAIHGW